MHIYRPRLSHLVWNSFSLLFSFLIVIILVLDAFLPAQSEVSELILQIDRVACVVFLGEFLFRLLTSRNKWNYLKWGWIDLLAAIPVTWFRFARLLKVVVMIRILVVLRRFFKLRRIFRLKYSARDIAGFIFLFFMLCLMLTVGLGSIIVLFFEEGHPNSSIQTPAEAVWWTLVTITTVGYGDYYPVTVGGRVMALILMFFGIGLFSTLTVYISSFLLQLFSNNNANDRGGAPPIAITREDLALELRSVNESITRLSRFNEQLLEKYNVAPKGKPTPRKKKQRMSSSASSKVSARKLKQNQSTSKLKPARKARKKTSSQ
ncbi:ion channel [Spirochaetota bacterium]|nr:ion channel [Spirochaetota bacterium]